jgi:hypothetical protein
MTSTEEMLTAQYGKPIVPLSDICEEYFGCGIRHARVKAARNALPVPTWRLLDSRRSPYMVRLQDLAQHIDKTAQDAKAAHEHSQL